MKVAPSELYFFLSDSQSKHKHILVKLIVSINRADGVEAAKENLATALKLKEKHPDIIKGLDLSGDPLKFTFKDFQPIFEDARANGLKTAIHCGEVTEKYEEVQDILEFAPDRLGHGTFIEGTYFLLDRFYRFKIVYLKINQLQQNHLL